MPSSARATLKVEPQSPVMKHFQITSKTSSAECASDNVAMCCAAAWNPLRQKSISSKSVSSRSKITVVIMFDLLLASYDYMRVQTCT